MTIENSLISTAYKLGSGQHRVQCPYCSSSRKKKGMRDLSINVESDQVLYHCHHCEETGKIKLEKPQAQVRRRQLRVVPKESYMELSANSIAWLKSRGISKDTALKLELKTSNTYIRSVDKETECVVFP